jgi:6-phosphogluconate dehydrogenase
MRLGMIGLGRMGGNIVRRLARQGHQCVVFEQNAAAIKLVVERVTGGVDLKELVAKLEKPRAVWIMLPAGEITENAVAQLGALLERDDTIIDGGNTVYKDDIRRAKSLKAKGIHYVDCGISGGVWGLDRGLMIGDKKKAIDRLDSIFSALAPGFGDIDATPERKGRDRRPKLDRYSGFVEDSGEGRWTKISWRPSRKRCRRRCSPRRSMPVFRSRERASFSDKLLSAMRNKFGGHVEPKIAPQADT